MSPLPTQKTNRQLNIADQTILVYGQPKIGKSTFCAGADQALFLATEPGLKGLDVYQVDIGDWPTFIERAKEVAAGGHQFRTIIIDTIDNLFRFCVEYVCQQLGVQHQNDAGYGKGADLIGGLFHRTLTRLCRLPYGVMMVSHSEEKEAETPTGKIIRVTPTIPTRARKIVLGMADMILYYEIAQKKTPDGLVPCRVIRTKTSDRYEAGDRTKCLPATIDLGDDPAGSYGRFIAAYVKGGGATGSKTTAAPEPVAAFDEAVAKDGEAGTAGTSTTANIPADSKAPPAPAGTASATAPINHLDRIRAAIAAATTTSELGVVRAEATKVLSRSEMESIREQYNAKGRALAGATPPATGTTSSSTAEPPTAQIVDLGAALQRSVERTESQP